MSTVVASSLIERLKELQAKEGSSDYKFADKLEISPQLWQMTRTGKREIGLVILRATLRAYPELSRDVLFFLRGDVSSLTSVGSQSPAHYQRAQNKVLAGLRFLGRKIIALIDRLPGPNTH